MKGYSKILKALTVTQKLSHNASKYGFPISIRAYGISGNSLILPRVKASAVKRTGAGDGEYHLHASEPIDMVIGDLSSTTTSRRRSITSPVLSSRISMASHIYN